MSGVEQSEQHRCPRRDENPHHEGMFGPDTWRTNGMEHPGSIGAGMRGCSYCGSMHPDDFMRAIEQDGWWLGPTDKNYKVYVQDRQDRPVAETLARLERLKAEGGKLDPTPPIKHHKFYFMHLSDEQKTRFVGLLNAKALNIDYPGRFYVLPYFIGRKEA